jgi:hypothetical protein
MFRLDPIRLPGKYLGTLGRHGVDGKWLGAVKAAGQWPRHVVRVCRSRRVRSLARASKGVMHVCSAGEGKSWGTGSSLEIMDIRFILGP